MLTSRRLILPILALGILHVIAGLAGLIAFSLVPGLEIDIRQSVWIHLAQILAFGSAAIWLISGSARDHRAAYLGGFLLLIATGYSERPMQVLGELVPEMAPRALQFLRSLPPDAFLPLLLWLFMREFPRGLSSPQARRLIGLAIQASALSGIALIAANALLVWSGGPENTPWQQLRAFDRSHDASHYWTAVFGLIVPALPFGVWRARTASREERRRASVLIAGLIVGGTPAVVYISLGALLLPAIRGTTVEQILVPLLQLGVISIPLATAYAVRVHQVLDVRVAVRTAIRYGLARTTVLVATAVPFIFFGLYLARARDATVAQLVAGPQILLLGGIFAAGLATLRFRHLGFDAIDRRFFREHYDSRQILAGLVDRVRAVSSSTELARLLASEIDRALHLDAISVLTRDAPDGEFFRRAGSARPLHPSSQLARRLTEAEELLELDLENPGSHLKALPLEEQEWLADGGVRLLVPLKGAMGTLLGILALGNKKSELPYSREDRLLLSAIAASGALRLESQLMESSGRRLAAADREEEANACECSACGLLHPAELTKCSSCGAAVQPAPVPQILSEKFRFERRIGAGGMGLVYLAVDLTLDRSVAVKTLPRVSPENAMRLRREARAAAAVAHPNLALIYGIETWHGTPMLIFEFLEGGTLADTLETQRLPSPEAVELGIVLARALERIHTAGILHRDVKPSNIGYTAERVAKLLDFGLAHMMSDLPAERPVTLPPAREGTEHPLSQTDLSATHATQDLVGTPLYLSPEALAGEEPDVSFDLWSTSLCLYEAITARHPLERKSWAATLEAIRRAEVPDIRQFEPSCPSGVARFFRESLGPDRGTRPGSAREMRRRLEELHPESLFEVPA